MEMSKMFGVERGEWFMVERGGKTLCKISAAEDNVEYLLVKFAEKHRWEVAGIDTLLAVINIAPSGIIHLPPPLTDDQREQLKAIWTLGGRWLVRDIYKDVRYFNEIPHKSKTSWQTGNDDEDAYYGYRLYNTLDICRLVSWSDPEPFDIGKALGYENKNNT